MQHSPATELYLIRHAPVIGDGCVYGRRDLPADCSDAARFKRIRKALPEMDHLLCSPALRCQKTAQALWPGCDPKLEANLWEQNFGDWEGLPFADLPDLGALDGKELAGFAPPNGESFDDICRRVTPVLAAQRPGRSAIIAHAGSIRAALSVALGGVSTALRFELANLSVTRITVLPKGLYCINEVNRCIE